MVPDLRPKPYPASTDPMHSESGTYAPYSNADRLMRAISAQKPRNPPYCTISRVWHIPYIPYIRR